MTRVTFETATLADVVGKADRIAPGKGKAFDKSSGVVIEISPEINPPVIIRATNLDIYSMEWVDAIEVSGPATTWRLPSTLLAQVVKSLPIGSGSTVTLEEVTQKNYTFIQLTTSGRTKAKFNMMRTESYPQWSAFDPDGLFAADDLGGRITQVEWAAAKSDSQPVLSGIHFDGEKCVATDRYRLAAATMVIPDLEIPITVPAGILGTILKQTGEIKIGIEGGQLLIMPDEHTQIRAVLFGHEYPKVAGIMKTDRPDFVTVKKTPLLEIIARACNFAGADRFPTLRMFFGQEEIAVMMDNAEVGLLGDVLEVPGQAIHARLEVRFTPKNIVEALTKSPSEEVRIGYDSTNSKVFFYIDGGSGYQAWVVPRGDAPPAE